MHEFLEGYIMNEPPSLQRCGDVLSLCEDAYDVYCRRFAEDAQNVGGCDPDGLDAVVRSMLV